MWSHAAVSFASKTSVENDRSRRQTLIEQLRSNLPFDLRHCASCQLHPENRQTMEMDLRRAMGTMSAEEFDRAASRFKRMTVKNLELARAYLLAPGILQVDIACEHKTSRQLVHKQCKKIFDAHCLITRVTRDSSD